MAANALGVAELNRRGVGGAANGGGLARQGTGEATYCRWW